jgi:hypothetical protein
MEAQLENLLEVAISLSANDRLELATRLLESIQLDSSNKKKDVGSYDFLKILKESRLEGPKDWSSNHDKYIYGNSIND